MLDNIARRALQSHVKASLKKIPKTVKPAPIKAGVVETVRPPWTKDVQRHLNRWRPGAGPNRATRATERQAAYSTIFSEAQGMKKAYPNEFDSIQNDIESWVRGGYAYARDKSVGTLEQPMKGYPRFIGPDGTRWRLKSQAAFGSGYKLSPRSTKRLGVYGAKRASRENPWTNEDEMERLMRALAKYGKAHKFAKLKQIMISDFNAGMAKIKSSGTNMSKGHLISLDNGGLDVAENFMPQQFKNTVKIIDGKKTIIKGNPAMKADSTTEFADGRGVASWDDYVRMKLHLL